MVQVLNVSPTACHLGSYLWHFQIPQEIVEVHSLTFLTKANAKATKCYRSSMRVYSNAATNKVFVSIRTHKHQIAILK